MQRNGSRWWWLAALAAWAAPLRAQPAAPPKPALPDPALLTAALQAHVGTSVDYKALKADARLVQWREQAAKVEYPAGPDERKALALNAYLVHSLSQVAARWPVHRLTELDGFFDRELLPLAGVTMTLDDLEDKVLRPLADPRTVLALASGARGAPRVPTEAWRADRIGNQLEAQATAFVNDPANVRVDAEQRVVRLSLWFRWYAADFEAAGGAIAFVAEHCASATTANWLKAGGYHVEWLPFDWSVGPQP